MPTTPRRAAAAPDLPAMPAVPGLVLCRPLVPGRPGPPWRARDVRSGHEVVVREVPAGRCRQDVEHAICQLPPHPHLLVPALHLDGSGRLLLATRHAAGGGLDRLLAAGPTLAAGAVATVAASVGRALVAVHAAGLTHGRVDAGAVLLGSCGRPLLDVTAMISCPLPQARAADDVAALGRLLRDALARPAPAALVEALAAAAGGGIDTAAELVRRVMAAAAPQPLRPAVAGPGPPRGRQGAGPRSPTGRRGAALRLLRSRIVVAAVAAATVATVATVAGTATVLRHESAAVAGAGRDPVRATQDAAGGGSAEVAAGSATADHGPSRQGATAGPGQQIVDWALVLADLDARRAEAFSAADPAALTDVDAAGSTLLSADQAALACLVDAGVRASGFRQQLRSVRAVAVSATTAVLDVVDERLAYELVRASDGATVGSWPARGPALWRVQLVLSPAGWQVSAVTSL